MKNLLYSFQFVIFMSFLKFKSAEFWRDIEAFGSFAFYFATIARAFVDLDRTFLYRLVLVLLLSQFLLRITSFVLQRKYFFKQKISSHSSNALALLILVNLFYDSRNFLIFSSLLYILLCIGHKRLRDHSWREVFAGAVIGAISTMIVLFFT